MLTESERIAICAVVGVAGIINGNFTHILEQHPQYIRNRILDTRDHIDVLVDRAKQSVAMMESQKEELELEISDRG